jgi:hypothetical protein
VDKVHNPVGFIEVSINAAIFNLSLRPLVFCRQRKVHVFARSDQLWEGGGTSSLILAAAFMQWRALTG